MAQQNPVRPIREGFQPDQTKHQAKADPPKPDVAEAPAPAPAPAPTDEVPTPVLSDEWPIKVRLIHKPIRTQQGDELRELTFREPTGGDINRYGNPVRVDQNGDILMDERKMTLMMAALSGVLSPILERMDPRDWNSCAYRLRRFFLPDPEAWW